ncbi:BTAD domain-containing putative transcriptional regulator [Streptomyces sp. NBRC 109706]|uniref:AfsR/SARP family transcriptional regulator n=1 Tax=Streptomyces sp. NBRC 109706 TaxID=1550035 RepID=UPI000A4B21BB|nr:BTAD domain-containing putative transcriptional regulator [Streptomyces sp. NBRC 109706]
MEQTVFGDDREIRRPRVAFGILGPLQASVDSTPLKLGGTRQRIVLATLLLNAGQVVSTDRLIRAMYEQTPPATARAQLHISVSGLRRLFGAHGVEDVISTHPNGYLVHADEESLDALRFDALVAKARELHDRGQEEKEEAIYRQALGLWRGSPLEGLPGEVIESGAGRLTEQRVTATEEYIRLGLALGRHSVLVGELFDLIAEFPLRERLRGQLMLALYRSGRQAEALNVYRETRRLMLDELGVLPDVRLRQLQHSILVTDPRLDLSENRAAPPEYGVAPTDPGAPEMLPAAVADFTGRESLVADVRKLLVSSHGRSPLAVPIVTFVGKPGVGKTATAIHMGHEVAADFPDGRLFAELHGGVSPPVSPAQALERFLHALGVKGTAIPEDMEERAEMYRALLAKRRMLIILDNVAEESQIRPLLPGKPTSAVIITSRRHIGSLAGAVRVDITTFTPEESADLLGRMAGAQRAAAEPEATKALAALCGHFPLALRIAGARLAARPHWEIAELVERLDDETRRLDELNYADVGIRAGLCLTYNSLGEGTRRLFRRLAILEEGPFSLWAAMALLDLPETTVRDLLHELTDAQLLDTVGATTGRHRQYRLHSLIRLFARERLAAEESTEAREAAVGRLLGCFLFLLRKARDREYGRDVLIRSHGVSLYTLPDALVDGILTEPLQWFSRERSSLLACVRRAAMMGFTEHCWGLAVTAVTFMETQVCLDDWRDTHEVALAASRKAGDRVGEAATLHSLGSLAVTRQDFASAEGHFLRSAAIFEEIGDEPGRALATRGLGYLARIRGRHDEATAHYEAALKVFREGEGSVAVAYVLHNLAQLRLDSGDDAAAGPLLSEALRLSREGNGRRVEAQVLHRLGQTYLDRGEHEAALDAFEQVLNIVLLIGDPTGEAYALLGIGSALLTHGETEAAGKALRRALARAEAIDERLITGRTLVALGELALATGDVAEAGAHLRRALPLFRLMDAPAEEAGALIVLHAALRAAGDAEAAERSLAEARELVSSMPPGAAGPILARLRATAGPAT